MQPFAPYYSNIVINIDTDGLEQKRYTVQCNNCFKHVGSDIFGSLKLALASNIHTYKEDLRIDKGIEKRNRETVILITIVIITS